MQFRPDRCYNGIVAVNAEIAARAAQQEQLAPAAVEYPPARQAWYCVFALALAVMINFLDRGILTLLVEPIKRDLKLSDVQMSFIMGFAFTFFYAVLGLPVARLVDRKSRTLIMTVGITIWSVMTMFCGLATNFWHLFIARMGLGVGETTSGPSAYSMLSDYFPPQRLPRAISFMQVGFVLGTGLALILGAWVIDFVAAHPDLSLPIVGHLRGWQMVLMLIGLPGLVVAAIMASVREPPRRGGAQAEPTPISAIFRFILDNKLVYLPLFIGMGLRTAQMFGLQMWQPAFYGRTFGWSPSQVGYVAGLSVFLAMPAGLLLGNLLAEHYWRKGVHDGNVRVVVLSTLISVPFGIAGPLMPTPWLAVACLLVANLTSIMAAAPENAAIQTVTPNRLRGQMTFLFLFIMNVIGMGFGPMIVGALNQYVFGEPQIRLSLATIAVFMGVPAIYVFRRGLRPYGGVIATGQPLP
jgi:MFS family permease